MQTLALSTFLEQVIAAIRAMTGCSDVALADVEYLAPLSGDGARVIVEEDSFRVETRTEVHVTGKFMTGVAAKAPSLWSLHRKGLASDFAELSEEHATAARTQNAPRPCENCSPACVPGGTSLPSSATLSTPP